MTNIGRSTIRNLVFVAVVSLSTAVLAHDDDIEGIVEKVDSAARSFVIKGQSIYVDGNTKYDDGLNRFEDIRVGDRLEVDVHDKNGWKVAHEIDRED
ncbi:DUF5666 domain-containing protein [Cupriavidus necator]